MKRNSIMIGLFAALMLVAGGLYATSNSYACDGCPAHAKAKVEGATSAAAGTATEATVQAADAKATSGSACCAAGKAAKAQMTGADASCATKTDAQKASAGKSCSAEGMKTASAGKSCSAEGMKTAAACASKEVWSAEATLTNLSHCGIDINKCDVDVLSAKLAEKGCGSYTKEQWASMINSARALDQKQAETILANAKNDKACAADACPMTQVAKELASVETQSKKN